MFWDWQNESKWASSWAWMKPDRWVSSDSVGRSVGRSVGWYALRVSGSYRQGVPLRMVSPVRGQIEVNLAVIFRMAWGVKGGRCT